MTARSLSGKTCFLVTVIVLNFCFWICSAAASDSEQTSAVSLSAGPNTQSELTEELWQLVRSLRQLRSDYYEEQCRRSEEIRRLGETTEKLQAEVEQLRSEEKQLDESLAEIDSSIRKLQAENEKDRTVESSVAKRLDEFVALQSGQIEKGIPYRREDRLRRLNGDIPSEQMQQSRLIADVFGRIWSFSQEEMRIARSGETFTELVRLDDKRQQHARLFRVGHQVLGYRTEQGGRAGIWLDGATWKKAKNSEAEAVRAAVEILDQQHPPEYILLPVKIESVDKGTTISKDK
jgi:predicted RNase H-like nuclease (RuvC/YqgF family)